MTEFKVQPGQRFESATDIEPHLEGLKDGVTRVELGGSSYGIGACKRIAESLATINSLEYAGLDDMFTGRAREEIPECMEHLLTALVNKPKLRTVNFSDNAFGIATIEPLEKFLAAHVPLEHLITANNGFGPQAGARIGAALETLASRKSEEKSDIKLRTVICGRNRLEAGSMEAWARFIKAHGTIEELRLYQNGIRQEGIDVLMREGLCHSANLRKLDLQDNTFTLKGSEAMADVLNSWPEIEEISISDCLLGPKGSVVLASALKTVSPKSLATLKLQYNEIEADGLDALYEAIEESLHNLESLELNGNRFSEDHSTVDRISILFGKRGKGELDELDDMEELTEDEDESESEEERSEVFNKLEAGSRDAAYSEDEPVAGSAKTDPEVADLTEKIAKTEL